MTRALTLLTLGLWLAACSGSSSSGSGFVPLPDGGTQARYDQLDQAHATLSIELAPDDTTAAITAALAASDGHAVTLQQGQSITVSNNALAQTDAGVYSANIAAPPTFAVTVDEPRHGVLTTTYTPPAAFQLTSSGINLAGCTVTWSPTDPTANVVLTLQQQSGAGVKQKSVTLTSDTGSHAFSDLDLRDFVQGYPLTLTIVKTHTSSDLQGVASSSVTVSRSRQQSVNPTST